MVGKYRSVKLFFLRSPVDLGKWNWTWFRLSKTFCCPPCKKQPTFQPYPLLVQHPITPRKHVLQSLPKPTKQTKKHHRTRTTKVKYDKQPTWFRASCKISLYHSSKVASRRVARWLIYYPPLPMHLGASQSGKQYINLCQREINGNQAPNSLSCFGKARPFSTYHKSHLEELFPCPCAGLMLHEPIMALCSLPYNPQEGETTVEATPQNKYGTESQTLILQPGTGWLSYSAPQSGVASACGRSICQNHICYLVGTSSAI